MMAAKVSRLARRHFLTLTSRIKPSQAKPSQAEAEGSQTSSARDVWCVPVSCDAVVGPGHVALIADVLDDGVQAARHVVHVSVDRQHRVLCSSASTTHFHAPRQRAYLFRSRKEVVQWCLFSLAGKHTVRLVYTVRGRQSFTPQRWLHGRSGVDLIYQRATPLLTCMHSLPYSWRPLICTRLS